MRRLGTAVVVAAIVLVTVGQSVSWANAWNGHGQAYTTDSGIGWRYSAEERAFFLEANAFPQASDGPEKEWTRVPACAGNSPGGIPAGCNSALCTTGDGEPGVFHWTFSRLLDPPDSPWVLEDTQCVTADRRVDLADVEAEVRRIIEDKFREIAQPRVELAPEGGGLVNLPVLAWTDDPGPLTLQIEQPLPGQIRATPDYSWQWSTGATSRGPGRPYSSGVSPTQTPDHYVHAVYRERGEGRVTLTVTWTGEVSVPGLPPIEIAPLVYTSPATFAVREARAQLVDAYD